MKSPHHILTLFVCGMVSTATAQVQLRDSGTGTDLWNELDACGAATQDPKAILAYIEPMIIDSPKDGRDGQSRSLDKEKILNGIEASIFEKNALRHELFERARHVEGDFTNPLLEAQIELHMLRQIWQSDSPLVAQQVAKVANLEETLPAVSLEKCLAHIWRRIALTRAEEDLGGHKPEDFRFKEVISSREFRSLRINALQYLLDDVRHALVKLKNR